MKGYKGFDKNLKCRDKQYEVGCEFTEDKVELCASGLHFCENPIDVFGHYPPADSRYCEVEAYEVADKADSSDSKRVCKRMKISAEIGIRGIVDAFVKFTLDRVDWAGKKESSTGDFSVATNTGYHSAATNTGYHSVATVSGKESVAIVTGYRCKARGSLGDWPVIAERGEYNGETCPIKTVKAVKVDGVGIKEDMFYMVVDGELKEVEE